MQVSVSVCPSASLCPAVIPPNPLPPPNVSWLQGASFPQHPPCWLSLVCPGEEEMLRAALPPFGVTLWVLHPTEHPGMESSSAGSDPTAAPLGAYRGWAPPAVGHHPNGAPNFGASPLWGHPHFWGDVRLPVGLGHL